MKHFAILLAMLSSSSAFAGNLIQNEESAVGAEVILRQIADAKHFGKDGLKVVKSALQGPGSSQVNADIVSMNCEPALGSKSCLISLKATNGNSFDVQVKIYQGKVVSGGPVQVED